MRIAILDNDPAWLELAAGVLGRAGHCRNVFRRGRELVALMRRETLDLVILGANVRDMPGDEVLRWIRGHCPANLPVLFVTAGAAPHDVVHVLNAGADDCLVKPVDPAILVAKVSALLRRSRAGEAVASRLEYRDFVFELKEGRAYRGGQHIALYPRQFQVAVLLFRNIARPLSRAYLFEAVWKQLSTGVSLRTVDTHVGEVRSRLRLRPEHGYLLAPVFGYGYRLDDLLEKGEAAGRHTCLSDVSQ
ncbi:response regulator transcription factor [Paraburkholderia kururiensis]|uniref:response regulator transcription factor n=3 Tax=Paraburkholderia kururiensis TaxID=984307 RepID=UPI001591ABA1|nr:response regulator transcription factor [Paraburkholderia kururiensis]